MVHLPKGDATAGNALPSPRFEELFDSPLLRLHGPLDAAMAAPDEVTLTDLGKLN